MAGDDLMMWAGRACHAEPCSPRTEVSGHENMQGLEESLFPQRILESLHWQRIQCSSRPGICIAKPGLLSVSVQPLW